MRLSSSEVKRLTNILRRTRKMRIKMKISKRISEGVFDYFLMDTDDSIERRINKSALELAIQFEKK